MKSLTRAVPAFSLALACLVPAAPVRADNPRISLTAENQTLKDIAERLSAEAKIPIDIGVFQARQERHSFFWQDVPLSRALRDLCEKLGLTCQRRGPGGYYLYPTGAAPAPGKLPGLLEKDGVRLYATSVSIYDSRYANWGPHANSYSSSNLTLQLTIETPGGDGDLIAGLANVVARDDLGNAMTAPQRVISYGSQGGRFPDEWVGAVSFPNPNARAKKLVSIEGDLLVHRKLKPQRVELPVPSPGKAARHEAAGMVFALSRYQESPKEDEDDKIELPGPRFAASGNQAGPSIRVRIARPADSTIQIRGGSPYQLPPVAIGESGKAYPANSFRGGASGSDGQWQVSDSTWVFPNMTERAVKLVWDFIQPDEPVKLMSFRMLDVPLPMPPAVVPQKPQVTPPKPDEPAEPERAFYLRGGPSLISRVTIGGRTVREGTLQIGLAPQDGAGWGAIRWIEVPISPDGLFRLTDLKPGTYRVSRRYRLEGARGSTGQWQNAVATVTVRPDREATLPPLARP